MLKVIEIENVHVKSFFRDSIYAAVLYMYGTLHAVTNATITDLKRYFSQPLHIINKLGQFMSILPTVKPPLKRTKNIPKFHVIT